MWCVTVKNLITQMFQEIIVKAKTIQEVRDIFVEQKLLDDCYEMVSIQPVRVVHRPEELIASTLKLFYDPKGGIV